MGNYRSLLSWWRIPSRMTCQKRIIEILELISISTLNKLVFIVIVQMYYKMMFFFKLKKTTYKNDRHVQCSGYWSNHMLHLSTQTNTHPHVDTSCYHGNSQWCYSHQLSIQMQLLSELGQGHLNFDLELLNFWCSQQNLHSLQVKSSKLITLNHNTNQAESGRKI